MSSSSASAPGGGAGSGAATWAEKEIEEDDSEELYLLRAARGADPGGWAALMGAGRLPLSLLVGCLAHPRAGRILSVAQRATMWQGLLRSAERACEAAPCGYLIAPTLASAVAAAASASAVAGAGAAHTLYSAPSTSSSVGQQQPVALSAAWEAYERTWTRTLAAELMAAVQQQQQQQQRQLQQEEGDEVEEDVAASGLSAEPSEAALAEAGESLDSEERIALVALRGLVAALEGKEAAGNGGGGSIASSPSSLVGLASRLSSSPQHVVQLQLQAAAMAARSVSRAVGQSVTREEQFLGRVSMAGGAAVSAAAAAKKKKKRNKGKKKGAVAAGGAATLAAASPPAALAPPPSPSRADAAGGKSDESDAEEAGDVLAEEAAAQPAVAATAAPPAPRLHPLAFLLVGGSSSHLPPAPPGRPLPLDPLYRSLIGGWAAAAWAEEQRQHELHHVHEQLAGVAGASPVASADAAVLASALAQAQALDAVRALSGAWAEYAKASLCSEGLSRVTVSAQGCAVSADSGAVAVHPSLGGGAVDGGSSVAPAVPVLCGTVNKSALGASSAAPSSAGVSLRALHLSAAARLRSVQSLLHALGCVSAGLADITSAAPAASIIAATGSAAMSADASSSFMTAAAVAPTAWTPNLPRTGLEEAARQLAKGQGISMRDVPASSPTSTAEPAAAAVSAAKIAAAAPASASSEDDSLVFAPLTDAEAEWVEGASEGLAPRVAPRPAGPSIAHAYAALTSALSRALADAGDVPAARRCQELGYWWLAEHVLLPAHVAGGGGALDGADEDEEDEAEEGEVAHSHPHHHHHHHHRHSSLPPLSSSHIDACALALEAWAAFERAHGSCAADADMPSFLAEDLRRRRGADAARNVLLAYDAAAKAGAAALVRGARRAHVVAQAARRAAAAAAAAAMRDAAAKAAEDKLAREAAVAQAAKAAKVAAAAAALKAGGGGGQGKRAKGRTTAEAGKAKVSSAPPPPPPPPPPPSLATLKAGVAGAGGAGQSAPGADPASPSQSQEGQGTVAELDLASVLAEAQAAALEAGRLGSLPLPAPPPIPDAPPAGADLGEAE